MAQNGLEMSNLGPVGLMIGVQIFIWASSRVGFAALLALFNTMLGPNAGKARLFHSLHVLDLGLAALEFGLLVNLEGLSLALLDHKQNLSVALSSSFVPTSKLLDATIGVSIDGSWAEIRILVLWIFILFLRIVILFLRIVILILVILVLAVGFLLAGLGFLGVLLAVGLGVWIVGRLGIT